MVTRQHPHERIRRSLRLRLEDGTYLPGLPLPPLPELAEEFGVNRLTVRKALQPLVDEGLLHLVTGRGFFVVGERVERDLESLGGFTRTMSSRRALPTVKVLSKTRRPAGPLHALTFGVDPGSPIYRITRLCLAAGEPFSLEEILIPVDVLPRFEELELGAFSLYDVYDFFGVRLTRAWQTLDLTMLDPKDARTLDITPETPVMLFECISSDEDERVIEFTRTYTRADRAEFVVQFATDPETLAAEES